MIIRSAVDSKYLPDPNCLNVSQVTSPELMPPAQRRVYLAAYCAAFNAAVARLLGDKAGGRGRSLEQVEAACDDLRLWGLMFGLNFVLDQYIETRSVQYSTV